MIFRKKKKLQTRACAVNLSAQGVSLAHVQFFPAKSAELASVKYCDEIFDLAHMAAPLKEWVAQQDLDASPCDWVLSPQHYELFTIDRPNVPEAELPLAAKWQIKDLIDFPVDQAAVEVFAIPPHGPGNQRKKIYVVVSRIDFLQQGQKIFTDAGLTLRMINVQELALRNLSAFYPEDEKGVALLLLSPSGCQIVMTQKQCVYFSRKIDLDFKLLSPALRASMDGISLEQNAADTVILEVTRSFDYYTTQLAQNAPEKILLSPSVHPQSILYSKLKDMMSAELTIFKPGAWINMQANWDDDLITRCMPAIGSLMGIPT